jgi:uncharacterized membrane protein HdeD (DUF308 family)
MTYGILCIVLGTIGLGMTFGLTLASVLFFGVLLLIGGGAQLLDAFRYRGWRGILWHVLIALLYLAGGVVMITDPLLASATLTLLLAWILIAVGITRSVIAFQLRPASGWWWPLLSGIASVLLGVMILASWPLSGLWVIGLFVAIELIFNGWSYLFVALAARSLARERNA